MAISLAAYLESGSLDHDLAVAIATRIGDQLAALHASGLACGKLSAANVLICSEDGRQRISVPTLPGVSPESAATLHAAAPDAAGDVYAYGELLRAMCASLRESAQRVPDWDGAIVACLDPAPEKRPSIVATMQRLGLPLSEATQALASAPAAVQGPAQWGQFHLLQRMGSGSFGEVYRAWDPVLEREVALKLLLPRDLNAEQQFAEIVAEARALARVRHPGIVAAYGVDRHDARVGFWSDFVRGRTLQRMVATGGPLPADEAAAIGVALCDALAAVHAEGLLHRDIKASNCMRDDGGRILLMDFGLSQELHQPAGIAGTPSYMAPELLEGQQASVQSDLYAVGVLLYYLATGTYPHAVQSGITGPRPAIPAALEQVIQKAIERNPENRWVSAARMGEALAAARTAMQRAAPRAERRRSRRHWPGIAAIALIGVGAILWPTVRDRLRARAAGTTPAAYQDYLAAEATLDRYDKPDSTQKAIALFGAVMRRSPNFGLAEAGLARADWRMYLNTSNQEWADRANNAAAAADKMNPRLAPVQLALGNLNIAQGHTGLGMQELQQAEQLDPMSADVHAGLAEAYRIQGRLADAKNEFQTAIDLAPDEWRWPYLRGALELDAGDYKDAELDFRTALDKTPDNSLVLSNLGITLRKEGRLAEAQKTYERSLKLNPREGTMISLGNVLLLEEKIPEAIGMYEKAVQTDPSDWFAWGELAMARYWQSGDSADVRQALLNAIEKGQEQLKTTPNDPFLISCLGKYYAHLHEATEALPLVRKALVLAPHDPGVLENAAESYEILGDRTEALQLVGAALRDGLSVEYARAVPELKALRADSRAPASIRN